MQRRRKVFEDGKTPLDLAQSNVLDAGKRTEDLIPVTEDTIWVDLKLAPERTYELLMDLYPSTDMSAKQSLIIFEFLGPAGDVIDDINKFPKSELGNFVYLASTVGEYSLRFTVPEGAVTTRMGMRLWHPNKATLQVTNAIRVIPSRTAQSIESRYNYQRSLDNEKEDAQLIPLSSAPLWVELPVEESLDLQLRLRAVVGAGGISEKSAVVWTQFFDVNGRELSPRVGSAGGSHGAFIYVDIAESAVKRMNVFTPAGCVTLKLGFATWQAKAGSLSIENQISLQSIERDASNTGDADVEVQSDPKKLLLDKTLVKHSYVPLSKVPVRLSVGVKPNTDLRVFLQMDIDPKEAQNKAGIMGVRFLSATGQELNSRLPMKKSDAYGQYVYLDAVTPGKLTCKVAVPSGCVVLELSLQTFAADEYSIQIRNQIGLGHDAPKSAGKVKVTPLPRLPKVSKNKRLAQDLKIAVLCDEFSYNSFSYEFDPIIVEPSTWKHRFELDAPDLFLCESAWSGIDSNTRPWKGKVYASSNFASENRNELLEIVEYCRKSGIPTVFWNKEDPTHFDDRVHDFVETAKVFDYVFTTDQDLLPRYTDEHGIKNIGWLPFATQPRLFNPINGQDRTTEVVFAGSWYQNHEARSAEMEKILDSILNAGMQLVIYDRYYGTEDPLHMFPTRFVPYTRPAVSHAELASIYKSSLFGLNINTVTDSTTMFARRVFELMSSNTLVLSNYSAGLATFFGDRVVILDGVTDKLGQLTDERVEQLRDENLHSVLESHTYRHRFLQILATAGVEYQKESGLVSFVAVVGNRDEARELIARFRFYDELSDQLLMVLDEIIPSEEIGSYYSEFNRHGVTVVSKELWRKQTISPERLVSNRFFVMIDILDFPIKNVLKRALLHRSYVDEPIIYGSANKYVYSTKGTIKNLIGHRSFLERAVMSYGREIRGNFYHV